MIRIVFIWLDLQVMCAAMVRRWDSFLVRMKEVFSPLFRRHRMGTSPNGRFAHKATCSWLDSNRQHAVCAGRYRSMPATKSGMLIGLARNGCPWISRPDLASALVTRAVRKTTGVLCNIGSDSIRAATSPPSVSGIAISRRIRSALTRCAVW
jgi:hypothetical protein